MNFQKLTLTVLVLVTIFTVACERKSRPVAARKGFVNAEHAVSDEASTVEPYKVAAHAGVEDVLPKAPGKEGALNGAELYKTHCSACHQLTGQGLPGVFPPLVKSPYVVSDNKERMAGIMLYGLMGPINVLGTTYNGAMTAVGMMAKLSNEELSAISGYVRSSWGNKADPIEAAVFEGVKKKYGARGPFNIQELGEEK